jgi:hypothetical protein
MDTPRTRRTPPRGIVAAIVLCVAAALASCGSSDDGTDAERPTADEAAEVITSGFGLDVATGECLQERFGGDDGDDAITAMVRGSRSEDGQRDALAGVLEACISAESFADAVGVAVAAAVPGSTPERDACVRGRIGALDPDQRRTVMLGLVLSGDAQVDDLQVQRAEIIQGVYDECGVSITPDTTVAATG